MNWFSRLFPHATPATTVETSVPDRLALQNELQTLRLELASRDQIIADLKQGLERQRTRQDQWLEETVTARLEGLFADVAAPASQILTQADLLEKQGKPLQARDILLVTQRMIRALQRYGLEFDGQPGQPAIFDPNRHTLMNNARSIQPGEAVTVRFAGVTFRDKLIYKSIVE